MTTLAFVDIETTGLHPTRHETWEVALIVRQVETQVSPPINIAEEEYLWQLPIERLGAADDAALRVNGFYERRAKRSGGDNLDGAHATDTHVGASSMHNWAYRFAELTAGAVLIGSNPSFDERRLNDLVRKHGAAPAWEYRSIDVVTLAAGYLQSLSRNNVIDDDERHEKIRQAAALPWKSDDVSRALGIEPDRSVRHTALGDARWACSIYDAVMS